MTDKSADAFRTISEVADDLGLPQHVLRFWETRFSQIKPLKRGGGRRYYRPDDIELLKGIQFLLYEKGFTIRGVQRILKENGNRFVIAIGSGDLSGLDSLAAGRAQSSATPEDAQTEDEDDVIVGESVSPRPIAGLLPSLRRHHETNDKIAGLNKPDEKKLNEAILELLECKRLLDQVR
ncbi:MerR family transcriptional regulator [Consotaella salsifontis]|uniref:MerR HTH family regulatory protein n=1 Tax=Consotaella salsifontis TaxID=1365950 RepID=A0A1T4P5E5_9HYPH|nr:MerR family transcriptional regulator [Consotaella salsifontis]SJZ86621.1 MerR HTH family regulatory protein [Consotaella salsifontis]